jgi:Helix-turn-helix domain
MACKLDRIEMDQRERDVLKAMHLVLRAERTQAEAATLLDLSVRQIRRIQRKLESGGDSALIHGLRGKPSNHPADAAVKRAALAAYRRRYAGFGPTLASEKLSEEGIVASPQTLRRWLMEAGLWERQRRRETHRSRRPRRSCFGELVQMDASIHDWLEGRGEEVVLITMIDDATSRLWARFYRSCTVQSHMELLRRWLHRHGRPLALYTDRHSIFEPQDKGRLAPDAETQFGRALRELEIGLIRARSPQAKGRVERSFGTAQDRWVKELRLAKAGTLEQANVVLERLLPGHNRKFAKEAREATDAHRSLGIGHDLASILSLRAERTVANDYTVRYENRFWQLHPPALAGLRGGKVSVEERLDGTMAILFGTRLLKYSEAARLAKGNGGARGLSELGSEGSAPGPPEFSALAADAEAQTQEEAQGEAQGDPAVQAEAGSLGMQPTDGRSGRTPAEPYPPGGEKSDSARKDRRPAQNHPWRKPFKPQK